MQHSFSGRRVAVTGGTSGLGLALVRELAGLGARVAFVARSADRVEQVVREHPGVHGIVGDVSVKEDIHPIAVQILGELGGLDVLVNNASSLGPVPLALLGDTGCEDLELALATNVLGPFRLTKALLGALSTSARQGRGAVVLNVSSDAAATPYPGWGAYGASKAALHHLTRIWDAELADAGVRFLSIDPGDMDTPLHALAVPDADRASLKQPEVSARELLDALAALQPGRGMIPATSRWSKASGSRLFVVEADGRFTHALRRRLVDFLRAGDLVIANDAATIPASLQGRHAPTGSAIEVRLAGWRKRATNEVGCFLAVVFGSGDFHTPTEHRPSPPRIAPGDRLLLGPLTAVVTELLGHARLVAIEFEGPPDSIWAGVARHGRPIQYAHVPSPLALWDVWTAIAGPPVSFEPPSAGFILEWRTLAEMRERGIEFATITHAAGISSTGDAELDARLPFDEPFEIPETTAASIAAAQARRARVVAIGTTVVRALEHAAGPDGRVRAGAGVATRRIGPKTDLRVVDAILTGIHEPGTSHHELLRAFADDETLARAQRALVDHGYRTHEFGDSALIERPRAVEGVMLVPPTDARSGAEA